MTPVTRGRVLLIVGAVAGLGLAATGLLRGDQGSAPVPGNAVATVNGTPIFEADYRRAVSAVSADRRSKQLSLEQRARILDRLIDEELLIQRGLELRLATRDPRIRTNLSGAVIDLIVARADAQGREVDDDTLRAFFREHRDYFRSSPRLHVQQEGDAVVTIPDVPLPPAKLRQYVGVAAARSLLGAKPGQVVRSSGNTYRLVARIPGAVPTLAMVKPAVLAEYRRRAGDRLLRTTLDQRRARSAIAIARERL